MKKSTAVLASLALAAMSTGASATTFFYTFTGGGTTATGSLNATANGGGSYTANSGTITETGLITPGSGNLISNPSAPAGQNSPSGFFFYDDQGLPGYDPLLTNAGLLFSIGASEINIFSNGPGAYTLFSNNGVQGATGGAGGSSVNGTFTLTQAVPEPATWAMMLLGFGMIGFAARNRRQKVRVTYA